MAVPEVTGPAPDGLRRAQQVAHDALKHIMDQPVLGLNEVEIGEEVERYLAAQGIHDTWCPTLVGVGDGTLVCHPDHLPSPNRSVREGDLVWVDVTPVVDGWFGDATQVWFAAGEPSPMDRRLRTDALLIERAGMAFAEPGMPACELFAHVDGLIRDAGYALMDLLGNVGHDIGTSAYEQGFIDADNRTPMWGGWTMEPHLGNGVRGAKFEDIVWLADGAKEVL